MASALIRLLALIALVTMPVGMSAAPAAAAPADHAMAMAHCDETSDPGDSPEQKRMDCAAACTALPASNPPIVAVALVQDASTSVIPVPRFAGVILDIATPPPRLG